MTDRAGNVSPVAGATGPGSLTAEMPDWYGIYYQPEAQKRQAKEAEQSRNRRRSLWRDFNYSGFHGKGDKPELRYRHGKTSVDVPHYVTAEKLRQHQHRIGSGIVDYEMMQGGKKAKR